ncbi:MAG: WXG100 family type VII secretion target [Mycobacterium sp.]
MTLRVNREDLTASGAAVTAHGESMATEHATADGRIDSALAGWQGMSASVLATTSAGWLQTTTALLTRMSDHAQHLHGGALTYSHGEERSSAQMRDVAARAAARQP